MTRAVHNQSSCWFWLSRHRDGQWGKGTGCEKQDTGPLLEAKAISYYVHYETVRKADLLNLLGEETEPSLEQCYAG